ncbi:trypsin zeta-like [Musca autumnalis]|uniref:trypsin zeta-like n=1 Tax=Musca autumnalis TaxID=221902 RepID=UPI003CF6DD83
MGNFSVINYLLFLITIVATIGVGQPFEGEQQIENGRIVGGYPVDITKHPHQVSLRHRLLQSFPYSHICGGSILRADVVLTAAHCVYNRLEKNYLIVAGTNLRTGSDGVVTRVRKIVIHEQYNSSITNNDVALMFLDPPLPLNSITVAPVQLANENEVPVAGSKAVISGWGTTAPGGSSSNTLLAVDVPIVSNESCDAAYAVGYGPGRITDAMLCAGVEGVGGKDACQGDSGGPLLVKGKLTGIVSWGRSCALPDYPGVYTNVPYFYKWITKTIEENVGK